MRSTHAIRARCVICTTAVRASSCWPIWKCLTGRIQRPCSPPISFVLQTCEHAPGSRLSRSPTWQFLLQVLVVFIAVSILCNQGTGLGITCRLHKLLSFSPSHRGSGIPWYYIVRVRRSVAVLLFVVMEGRRNIHAFDELHPVIFNVSKLFHVQLTGSIP